MKRLLTLALVALLSLGIASVSLAQEGTGDEAPAQQGVKTPTKHKKQGKKQGKKHRKGKKTPTPSA